MSIIDQIRDNIPLKEFTKMEVSFIVTVNTDELLELKHDGDFWTMVRDYLPDSVRICSIFLVDQKD